MPEYLRLYMANTGMQSGSQSRDISQNIHSNYCKLFWQAATHSKSLIIRIARRNICRDVGYVVPTDRQEHL